MFEERYDENMRSRTFLLAFLLVAGAFALPLAAHAAIPFFGPIIPKEQATCAASWGLIVVVVNNIISLLITLAIVFVAPLMIAWSGFLFVVNPVNSSGISEAKKILTNTVVGIVIALAGWLIVDALMAVLYNANAPAGSTGGVLGTWSDLVGSKGVPPCIPLATALNNSTQTLNPSTSGLGVVSGTAPSLPLTGDCSPSSILSSAARSPYPLTQAQANTLSCLAIPESNCNINAGGATTPGGVPSYALGVFQIVPGYSDACHSLNIPSCYAAAGVSGPLNCSSAFRCVNQVCTVINAELWNACQRAGKNFDCNVAAAACLVKANPTFGDWTGDPRSSVQRNCINTYNR
jgi:hypothetical protein